MIDNILGSIFNALFLASILRVVTPILLPSLGALISDRAGVINIGLFGHIAYFVVMIAGGLYFTTRRLDALFMR